ncbi:unnamed protein product [Ceratitis capitata]|uniref:(Mediterranean fruit fly) hypothetical protein n=1 Tax=Ceratitis capitata TaxID=7213 RepID=A0A811VFF7_CERCA|nr:unnamed protein product [Ceratitis capitata]
MRCKTYFYGLTANKKDWFIKELLPGCRMGVGRGSGSRKSYYALVFAFKIDDPPFWPVLLQAKNRTSDVASNIHGSSVLPIMYSITAANICIAAKHTVNLSIAVEAEIHVKHVMSAQATIPNDAIQRNRMLDRKLLVAGSSLRAPHSGWFDVEA